MSGLTPFNRNKRTPRGVWFNNNFYDNFLDDFFSGDWPLGRGLQRNTFRVDVQETDKEYLIEAELPGIKKKDIDLATEGDTLSIYVNSKEEIDEEKAGYIHKERRVGSMARRMRLVDADLKKAKAELKEGILKIKVPKKPETDDSHKIDIAE